MIKKWLQSWLEIKPTIKTEVGHLSASELDDQIKQRVMDMGKYAFTGERTSVWKDEEYDFSGKVKYQMERIIKDSLVGSIKYKVESVTKDIDSEAYLDKIIERIKTKQL
jgi:hypothetical protein